MAKKINIPNFGVIEVPDNFTEEQANAIFEEISGGAPQAQEQPQQQLPELGVTGLPPEQPQQALGEGLTFKGPLEALGVEGSLGQPLDPALGEATFRRTAESVRKGEGFLKQTGQAGLDLLGLIVGAPVASAEALFTDETIRGVIEKDPEKRNLLEAIGFSPATGASVLTAPVGAGIAAGKFGAQALSGLGKLAPLVRGAAAGTAEGVISAGTGVSERALAGEDLSLGQAGIETAIGAAVPILGGVIAAGAKKAIVKPAQNFFIDLAEESGKISEETLRMMATRAGSKTLKNIRLNERAALETGENVTDLITNFARFNTSENQAVKKSLSRMGKIDLNPVVAKIDDLKIKPRAGREILDDAEKAVNDELDKISLKLSSGDAVVSAEDFYLDRVDLDKSIKWEKLTKDFPKAAAQLEAKIIELAGSMRKSLRSKAIETGNEAFIPNMESLFKKLTVKDKLVKNIGRNKEAFVNNLQGKNKTEFRENLKELDELFGTGFTEKSKLIQLASELNKRGKLPITGREGIKAIIGSPRAISTGIGLTDLALKAPTSSLARVGLGIPARAAVEPNTQRLQDLQGGQ